MSNNDLQKAVKTFASLDISQWLSETETAYKTRLLILMSDHITRLEEKLGKLEADSGYIPLRYEWVVDMYGEPKVNAGSRCTWPFYGGFFVMDKWDTRGRYYSMTYHSGVEVANRKELIEVIDA